MRARTVTSAVVLGAVAALAAVPLPARAVTQSGTIAGGPGAGACEVTAGCLALRGSSCAVVPDADTDSSVRRVTFGGRPATVSWSRTVNQSDTLTALRMAFFGANCAAVGEIKTTAASRAFTVPAGAAYMVVWVERPHAQVNWQLTAS